jgi:phosphatidylglycerol:prolipoprotein diacylglycerol transferase
MSAQLFALTDSVGIHSFGVILAIGFLVFTWFFKNDIRFSKFLPGNRSDLLIVGGVLAILLGGRIVYWLSEWEGERTFANLFTWWDGGFSVMGSTLAIILWVFTFIWWYRLPLLNMCDYVATYMPIIHSFGRIGCFFAGCCFGIEYTGFGSVIYKDPYCGAPLDIYLFPVQLVSSFWYALLFLFLYISYKKSWLRPGYAAAVYLLASSAERFFLDFIRGDRVLGYGLVSFNQWIALSIFALGIIGFLILSLWHKR